MVDSDPRSGRPSLTTTPENIDHVRLAIEGDRRLTVRELENDLGIPKTTVWEILNKILGMTRVRAKFIPKLLTTEQKDLRSEIAQDNLEMVSDDENVLKKFITGDKSWVYSYDPETKQQSSQWGVQTSHGRKKYVKVGAMSSQYWLFFSIVRVLCTTNLLQEVRRSTKNIALKFWKDCVMLWEESDRVSGQAGTGFFTTITRQRIHRTLCSNFWRNIRSYSFASLRSVRT